MHLNIVDLNGPEASRNARQIGYVGNFLVA
jgi:hypothetical protein